MGREGKKGSGRQRLPASGGAEGDQCSTLNVPPSVGIPQHCGTQLSTGQFTTKARRGGVPCQSCRFRRPQPPLLVPHGIRGRFRDISGYFRVYQLIPAFFCEHRAAAAVGGWLDHRQPRNPSGQSCLCHLWTAERLFSRTASKSFTDIYGSFRVYPCIPAYFFL